MHRDSIPPPTTWVSFVFFRLRGIDRAEDRTLLSDRCSQYFHHHYQRSLEVLWPLNFCSSIRWKITINSWYLLSSVTNWPNWLGYTVWQSPRLNTHTHTHRSNFSPKPVILFWGRRSLLWSRGSLKTFISIKDLLSWVSTALFLLTSILTFPSDEKSKITS